MIDWSKRDISAKMEAMDVQIWLDLFSLEIIPT